jgi:hypothetical protein
VFRDQEGEVWSLFSRHLHLRSQDNHNVLTDPVDRALKETVPLRDASEKA